MVGGGGGGGRWPERDCASSCAGVGGMLLDVGCFLEIGGMWLGGCEAVGRLTGGPVRDAWIRMKIDRPNLDAVILA